MAVCAATLACGPGSAVSADASRADREWLAALAVVGLRTRQRVPDRVVQRVAAGVLGIAVFALAAIGMLRAFSSDTVPADETRSTPFVGTWQLFADDSLHTLGIRAAGDGTFALELSDEAAAVCAGLSATETGVGTLSSSTQMSVASQVITCQDGTVLRDESVVCILSASCLRPSAPPSRSGPSRCSARTPTRRRSYGSSSATRSGCGPPASSWGRSAVPRRSTCSRP